MSTSSPILRRALTGLVLAGGLLAGGCATYNSTYDTGRVAAPAPGLGVGDLIKMLNENRPQSEIIAEVRSRGVRAQANSADVEALRNSGATPELIAAVQEAPVTPVTTTTVVTRSYYPYPWFPFAFGFGYSRYWGGYGGGYYARPPVYVAPGFVPGPRFGGGGFRGGGGGGFGGGGSVRGH